LNNLRRWSVFHSSRKAFVFMPCSLWCRVYHMPTKYWLLC